MARSREPHRWRLGPDSVLVLDRPVLMGVLNVTPDSFSDGGKYDSVESALRHSLSLVEAGADILDIGGESTRPGAPPVSPSEEMTRIIPVIEAVHAATDTPISVDTTKSSVAREAVRCGATMINDISGLTFDPKIADVAAQYGCALCLMHIQGTPQTMQKAPEYRDVLDEVTSFLSDAVQRALAAGVEKQRICVDPGIGFGKRLEHNMQLINGIAAITERLHRPVLAGVSRKSFIGHITDKPVESRLFGTIGAVAVSILRGAHIVRVHDVAEVMDAVHVVDELQRYHR